ncbi:MAG: T9SS type A sorting domain-containing protein [Brumimicrobium sp.]|nr:T9SS type A sorting domain-containing protein [Brumimicrobium sp.]
MSTGSTHITLNKVNIIPEGGIDNAYSSCSNFDLRPVDEMTLGFSGIAGFLFWDGRGKNADSINNLYLSLWKNTFRALNHMNGDDVIGTLSQGLGQWNHYSSSIFPNSKKYEIELQSYISNNKTKAVGYIKNNTYNVFTRGVNQPCSNSSFKNDDRYNSFYSKKWNKPLLNKRLRIENLKNKTDYKIEWYSIFGSYPNGYIKSDCQKTNKKNGKWGITLEHPELILNYSLNLGGLPVVWFVIKEGSCSNGMIKNEELKEDEYNYQYKTVKQETITEDAIRVYPNPFDNEIIIYSPKDDNAVLQNSWGEEIEKWKIVEGESTFITTNLAPGVYLLRFINQTVVFKIVKL